MARTWSASAAPLSKMSNKFNTIERTVGAALRGRPWFGIVFAKPEAVVFRSRLAQPRAATEGRPYSTFDQI